MQARYMKSRQDGQEESDSEHTNSAQPRIPRHKAPSPMPNLCSLGETTDATSASHRDSYASDQYDFDTSQDESTRPDRIDRTSDVSFVSAREHIGAQNARRDKRNSNRHSLHQRPISEEDESHAPQDTTSIADWSSSKDLLISPTEEGCGPQLSALMDSVEGQDSDSDIIKYARRTCSKDSHSGDELEAPLFDEDPDSYRTSQDTTVGSSCEHQGKSREQEDLHRQLSRLNALVDSQRSHFDQDRDTMAAQMKRLESDLAQIQLCNSEQASASHRLETELFEAKQALRQSQLALRSSQDEMRSSQDDKVVAFERVGELEKRLERIEAERLSRSNEFNRMLLIITNTARERDLLKARLHKSESYPCHYETQLVVLTRCVDSRKTRFT